MLLVTLKHYVKNNRQVSLAELVNHFRIDTDIVREMLNFLIRKGQVIKKNKTQLCGIKCVKCQPSLIEVYEWV